MDIFHFQDIPSNFYQSHFVIKMQVLEIGKCDGLTEGQTDVKSDILI